MLFVADGRDANTVAAFADDLEAHNGDASRIKEVCIDMSGAFIKGVADNLTEAEITFDKFHAVKLVNDAVDKVRRAESKDRPSSREAAISGSRTSASLRRAARTARCALRLHLKTARAYRIRLAFQEIYDQPPRMGRALPRSLVQVGHPIAASTPMKDAARTIKRHRDGILSWFTPKIANGLIEGINSLVQAAKAKARGYRSTRNLKAITYLIAGKLDLRLPT